jgi:hypothetical protein
LVESEFLSWNYKDYFTNAVPRDEGEEVAIEIANSAVKKVEELYQVAIK